MGLVWRMLAQLMLPERPNVTIVLAHTPCDPTFVVMLLEYMLRITATLPRWEPWHNAMQILSGGARYHPSATHTGEQQ
jgi:hypothetical protein